jgi:hypothetical protein
MYGSGSADSAGTFDGFFIIDALVISPLSCPPAASGQLDGE